MGPGLTETFETPDHLKEAGIEYVADFPMDDQPFEVKTEHGPLISIPYTVELNDIPMIVGRKMDAAPVADMIVDNFEEMLAQSEEQPLVMGIALHPYLFGQPYRLMHLRRALAKIKSLSDERVWWTTSGAIADHFKTVVPPSSEAFLAWS